MKNTENGERRVTPTLRAALEWAQIEAGYQASVEDILGPIRKKKLVRLRQLAQWRLRTEYLWSFPRIALAFDGRDHSSVMHLVRRENIARGYPQYHPMHGNWAKLCEARHEAHVLRMALKYAGGASYA